MKETLYNQDNRMSFIQLKGEPYQRAVVSEAGEEQIDCSVTLTNLANATGYVETLPQTVFEATDHLGELLEGEGYYGLDKKLKHGEDLTFDEAFSLGTFVCAGLNKPLNQELAGRINELDPRAESHESHLLQATALLSAMSAKEGYQSLTPEEIAGVVAATIKLDTVLRLPTEDQEPILAFGGMGGDRGYPMNGENTKLFSLSTLSSIVLAADGNVHKHHSYPNTSKVAGQSAIEAIGARSDFHTPEAFSSVLEDSGLVMSSCHDTRTLHTLSHLLRGETINHVIGPLSFTMAAETPIHGFIGVNEKIHPETIIDSLRILDEKGFQRYGNSAAFCGTDLSDVPLEMLSPESYYGDRNSKRHVALDEVAPPPYTTMAAFLVNGENAGTYLIKPEDFYEKDELARVSFGDLVLHNDREEILHYNQMALEGRDPAKARYLAMTVGLGLFVRHDLGKEEALDSTTRRVNPELLRARTQQAFRLLKEGQGKSKAAEYVAATQKYAGR